MTRYLAPLALLAGLGACGAPSPVDDPAANVQQREIRITNDFHDRLMRALPMYQRVALKRAIVTLRYRCTRLENAGFQQDHRNLKMWVAHCAPENRDYAVFIAPNGDVQVRYCTEAATLELPLCRALPPAADTGIGAAGRNPGNASGNTNTAR